MNLATVLLEERDDAPVRDNEGVDIRLRRDNRLFDLLLLALEHDGVERQIASHLRPATSRDLGQILNLEIDAAPRPHVERAKAKIHRIRARIERGLQTDEIPRRG